MNEKQWKKFTKENEQFLTDSQFKKSTVSTNPQHTYFLWDKEFFVNGTKVSGAVISIHVIDGNFMLYVFWDDKYRKLLRHEVNLVLAQLKVGGIE